MGSKKNLPISVAAGGYKLEVTICDFKIEPRRAPPLFERIPNMACQFHRKT